MMSPGGCRRAGLIGEDHNDCLASPTGGGNPSRGCPPPERERPSSSRPTGMVAVSPLKTISAAAGFSPRVSSNTWTTVKRVILPLLRPAILAALVYSFVRAMTAVSAVIFLVSAEYDMATSYILGRVENNDYGISIAYCSVLILVMFVAVGLFQLIIGERRIGRRTRDSEPAPVPVLGG